MSVGSAEPVPSVGIDPWVSHGFGQDESDDDEPPSLIPGDDDDDYEPPWVCVSCGSPDGRRMGTGYRCSTCGCAHFIDQNSRSSDGLTDSWTFVPS